MIGYQNRKIPVLRKSAGEKLIHHLNLFLFFIPKHKKVLELILLSLSWSAKEKPSHLNIPYKTVKVLVTIPLVRRAQNESEIALSYSLQFNTKDVLFVLDLTGCVKTFFRI